MFSPTAWAQYLIDQEIIPKGAKGVFMLLALLSLATSIGLPRQIAAFTAGYSLGAFYGAAIATIAATIGCYLTFTISRHLLSKKINNKFPTQIKKVSLFISKNTVAKTIIIRLLPLGSNLMTNLLAGVTRVSAKRYLLGSFLGFIPQMLIFSFAGSGVKLADEQQFLIGFGLFAVIAIISSWLIKQSSLIPSSLNK